MSDKICIIAGTTEGRKLAKLLKNAAEVTCCVATEYGEVLLDEIEGITVHAGRMDAEEMAAFFKENHFDRIIDATHPYAQIATENVAAAAKEAGIPLLRILREKDNFVKEAVYVSSVEEAKDFLMETEGNILITTGAKELSSYVGLDMARVWPRVLPLASSLESCEKAGIPSSHIVAAQGPFSEELNLAQLKMINAKYLVTKASGRNGGFEEKIRAALSAGAVPVIIGQPPQTEGLLLDDALLELGKTYQLPQRKITLIGIGPGSPSMLIPEAERALEQCDAVVGASSVVESLHTRKPCYNAFTPVKVREVLEAHPSVHHAAVVLRGDTGFFSGATNMIREFELEDVSIIPGISSLSAFASRLGVNWDDAVWISVHGRDGNVVSTVARNKKVFILTGGQNTPSAVCRKLAEYGFGELFAAVGERLSYLDEKLVKGSISALSEQDHDSLSLLYVENPEADDTVRFGIDDEAFERGDVPMTKAEVRAVSMAKLEVKPDSVVWDVGAGTGSVSIECAMAAYKGQVYAIERKADAAELIRKNQLKFKTDNINVIEGSAPAALEGLPVPTHAFIGGSGGKLREILAVLLDKNPGVRIVMNTITLESQAEASACLKEYGFELFEAVSVNVSRSRKAGPYHLMMAQNPVTVFVMQKRTDK